MGKEGVPADTRLAWLLRVAQGVQLDCTLVEQVYRRPWADSELFHALQLEGVGGWGIKGCFFTVSQCIVKKE